jgi:hypothetical protein
MATKLPPFLAGVPSLAMSDCSSAQDPKLEEASWLYLPADLRARLEAGALPAPR